jgi:hypothetical protein
MYPSPPRWLQTAPLARVASPRVVAWFRETQRRSIGHRYHDREQFGEQLPETQDR